MSFPVTMEVQGLQPLYGSPKPLPLACCPPIGGHIGTGAPFVQGEALSVSSTTPANAVYTQTCSPSGSGGGLSGNIVNTIVFADGPHIVTYDFDASTDDVLAAFLAAFPAWDGAIAVTGTPATSYVITFGGYLADQAIGGMWTATVTGGTADWDLSTPGSSDCQYDAYSEASNDHPVAAFVVYDFATDYSGAEISNDIGSDALGQPADCTIFTRGIFDPNDLVGLDANAYTITPNLVKKSGGTLVELL